MTSSSKGVHLSQCSSPSEQRIRMPHECPGTQVKLRVGRQATEPGRESWKVDGSGKKGGFPPVSHTRQLKPRPVKAIRSLFLFWFVFPISRVRNLNPGFLCGEAKFFLWKK